VVNSNPGRQRPPSPVLHVQAGRLGPEGEAAGGIVGTERLAEGAGEGGPEHRAASEVHAAGSAQVPVDRAIEQQLGHCALGHVVALPVHQPPVVNESLHHPWVRHDEADPRPRGEGLGQGAHVHHAAMGVVGGEREDRATHVVELVVVVVLEHEKAPLPGELQEL
jgi:hypothetical protein